MSREDKVIAEKLRFILGLEPAIKNDDRSDLKSLQYKVKLNDDNQVLSEHVEVEFLNGYVKNINVTGNSNGAIYKAIGKAIYGGC